MEPTESVVREVESTSRLGAIEYEYDANTPASIAVIHAICMLTDVDPVEAPTELGFVLHEHVDPSALDSLLGDGTGDGRTTVSFEMMSEAACAVEISDDGRIIVERSDSSSSNHT